MILTLTRTVYRILGIPVASVTRQECTTESDGGGETSEDDSDSTPMPQPELTQHGYAYSCSECGELLLEGLAEPLIGADYIELALHHDCQENAHVES
ncbi:hypothetical protein [Nocardia terpenica]|uniref:Uncharacterized protein n=1 Tax=Nocardia terpenica TaxID=455432 RepID=A0A164LCZ8_9NOCA|nr:hypothetical protein [Nocardia terpenica]KZM72272.1 hypothetical protein AWN90_36975 [Nocardia terpenica]NQE86582.1 hypothetical protein [Nocardia terpenica]